MAFCPNVKYPTMPMYCLSRHTRSKPVPEVNINKCVNSSKIEFVTTDKAKRKSRALDLENRRIFRQVKSGCIRFVHDIFWIRLFVKFITFCRPASRKTILFSKEQSYSNVLQGAPGCQKGMRGGAGLAWIQTHTPSCFHSHKFPCSFCVHKRGKLLL